MDIFVYKDDLRVSIQESVADGRMPANVLHLSDLRIPLEMTYRAARIVYMDGTTPYVLKNRWGR